MLPDPISIQFGGAPHSLAVSSGPKPNTRKKLGSRFYTDSSGALTVHTVSNEFNDGRETRLFVLTDGEDPNNPVSYGVTITVPMRAADSVVLGRIQSLEAAVREFLFTNNNVSRLMNGEY